MFTILHAFKFFDFGYNCCWNNNLFKHFISIIYTTLARKGETMCEDSQFNKYQNSDGDG